MIPLDTYKQYRDWGLATCPAQVVWRPGEDGAPGKWAKKPIVQTWREFQDRLPTDQEIESWASLRAEAMAVICGKGSGGMVAIDIDAYKDKEKAIVSEFTKEVAELGGAEILRRCTIQETRSGGLHIIFRVPGNDLRDDVLAKTTDGKDALIETRANGGLIIAHPTPGYKLVQSRFDSIPTLTHQEADLLYSAAWILDRAAVSKHAETMPPATLRNTGELTPIDDYNARATVEDMQAEIEAAGFAQVRQRGPNIHYKRPGKSGRDTSATLHVEKKRFYVFTTSTELEANKAYSPAALQCFLHNRGDWTATAGSLRRAGFGGQRNKPSAPSAPPAQKTAQPEQHEVKPKSGAAVVSATSLLSELREHYRRPFDPGASLPWPEFDPVLKLKRPRLNLLTGIPGSGKSTWLNQVFLTLADREKWKVAIFSPESASPAEHLSDLVEVLAGKPFFGARRLSEAEAMQAAESILKNVAFIDQPREGATFDEVLAAAESIRPDALLIDPWNRLMHNRPEGQTETEYIGACLSKAAAFAKALNLSFWIVAHPQKIRRDKEQKLLRPGLYDVAGSANWANMIDVGIVVWRNYERGSNEIEIIKVRHKRDGEPGLVEMKFDKEVSRFRPWTNADNFIPPVGDAPTSKNFKRISSPAVPSLPKGDDDQEDDL